MKRTTLRRATLASAALALVPLSSCSSDPEPRMADPSPTPATSEPTTAAVDEPPSLPTAAEENSSSGAIAFADFFWDAANYGQATGDMDLLASYSADTCEGCQGAIEYIEMVYRKGGTIEGGAHSLAEVEAGRISAGDLDGYNVTYEVAHGPQVISVPGEEVNDVPADRSPGTMVLTWVDGRFRVDILDNR